MSDSVDRVFVHALNTVKRIPRTGSARPPESDRVKLYGLYKQSMEGDVDGVMQKPEGGDKDKISDQEKWEAWHSHAGLSRTEAKRQYISTLIETMHRYATTTPEARELVAELDFVWDQIKSNSASSSASSPEQLARSQGIQQNSTSGYGKNRARRDEGAGLRVLRPLSDRDEKDEAIPDEIEYGRPGALDEEEDTDTGVPGPLTSDLEARNLRWRKRIEQTLVKMTAEIAALREQMEARKYSQSRRASAIRAWTAALLWASIRHLLVDAALLAGFALWARRRGDDKLIQGLGLLFYWVKERARRFRIPGSLKVPSAR